MNDDTRYVGLEMVFYKTPFGKSGHIYYILHRYIISIGLVFSAYLEFEDSAIQVAMAFYPIFLAGGMYI